ncbi:MAG: GNAT family N-acetyltransferase [Chloroflexia bacterium]
MLKVRALENDDREALQALLMREPQYNAFHLSALSEFGLGSGAWAVGVFRGTDLVGMLMALRGTGGAYHVPGDAEALEMLADAVHDRVLNGRLALLSGHTSQLDPLLPMVESSVNGRPDRCHFRVLLPGDLALPERHAEQEWFVPDLFKPPRRAHEGDMERLIDFYLHGFYSLARLPSREAWRSRLSEQLAFRTLYLIEDREGAVASAALSSAEGGGAAILGGVATLDSYRGLGLSTQCVGALCAGLFAAGAESIGLFYLNDNTPAGRVYDKLGFRPAGEWLLVPMGLGILFGG